MIFERPLIHIFLLFFTSLALYSQNTEIPVPLEYWGQNLGEVRIRVNSVSGSLQGIHREALVLMKNATVTTSESLDRVEPGEFPNLTQWRSLGWDFVLNPETVTLVVVLSPEAERPRKFSLSREQSVSPGDLLPGALWSTVLNGALEVRWVNFSGIPEEGSLDWEGRMDLYGALRGGWSLWTSTEADSRRTPVLSLSEIRLTRDFPQEGLSLGLGTISSQGQGWVQTPALWGFSFGTDFNLQPEKSIQNAGSFVLFLSEPSTLVVRQNDQVTGRLTLPAGPLELKDIPLRQGINQVNLEITGTRGTQEIRVIELPFLSSLLAPDVMEYHTSIGLEQNYPDNFRWNLGARRGFSETVTLGAGVQGDRDELLAAGEASLATPVGSFRTDVGLGVQELTFPFQPAGALGIQYDWQHASRPGLPRVSLGLQWKSEGFRSPTRNRTSAAMQSLGATGSVNVPLFGIAMATFIARTQWAAAAPQLQHQISGILSVHPGDVGIFTLRGAAEQPASGSWIWGASLNWSFSPDSSGFSSTLGQDLLDGGTLVQGSQTWEPDSFSQGIFSLGGAGNGFNGDLKSGSAGFRYQNPLWETSLTHNSDKMTGGPGFQHTTRYRAAAALAAADGLVSFSRPVSGSFVVAEVLPEYRPYLPVLRTQTGGGAAPLMPWGTGILSNLKAYQVHKLTPDSLSLPPGFHLGAETLAFKPERFQGARLLLGSRSIITLESRLLDKTGKTVVLKAGTLRSEDGKHSHNFFTNRLGEFQTPGLSPGRHVLTLVDGRTAQVVVGDPQSLTEEIDFIMVE